MSYRYLRIVDIHCKPDIDVLFKLLAERTPSQGISHKKMPTHGEHARFVKSCPYKVWYLIGVDEGEGPFIAGATYLTHANELGIFIFRKYAGKGYGKWAVQEVMSRFEGPFLANISPENAASQRFFSALGFEMIQYTYTFGGEDAE